MKSLATLALLVSTQALAVSDLQQLMYFPKASTLWGSSAIEKHSDSYDTQTATSKVKQSEISDGSWVLKQNFNLGVMDQLEVGAQVSILFGGSLETKSMSTNATTEKKYSGIEDLVLNSRFRLFTEKDMGLNLDLSASLSPSLSNDKEATTTTDGNAQRGGHQVVLGAKAGSSFQNFSWDAFFNLVWTGERKEENAQTGVEQATWDSSMDFILGVDGQLEFDPLTFGGTLSFRQIGATDYTLKSSGTKTNYDSTSAFTLGVNASMAVLDNLVGFTKLDLSFVSDQNFKAANVDYQIADRKVLLFQLGAKYSF